MSAQFIIVRPRFDTATEYSFKWCQDVIDHLESEGLPYVDLKEGQAVRSEVESALKNSPDAMLVHYDHGDTTELVGNDMEACIDLSNVNELCGHECYNMNCLSGKVLGAVAHSNYGCPAYWGYTDVVSFTTDALTEFKTALNNGFFERLKGTSWEDCVTKTKELMQQLTEQLINGGKTIAAIAMANNMNALICYNGGGVQPSVCKFRLALHKMLPMPYRNYAWRISRKFAAAILLQLSGTGLALFDVFEHDNLVGSALVTIGLVLWFMEDRDWLTFKKKRFCWS